MTDESGKPNNDRDSWSFDLDGSEEAELIGIGWGHYFRMREVVYDLDEKLKQAAKRSRERAIGLYGKSWN